MEKSYSNNGSGQKDARMVRSMAATDSSLHLLYDDGEWVSYDALCSVNPFPFGTSPDREDLTAIS